MNNNYPMSHCCEGTVIVYENYNYIRSDGEWRCLGPSFELFEATIQLPERASKSISNEIDPMALVTNWSGHLVKWFRTGNGEK